MPLRNRVHDFIWTPGVRIYFFDMFLRDLWQSCKAYMMSFYFQLAPAKDYKSVVEDRPWSWCRYLRGSEMCEKVAQSLTQLTYGEERELFDFGQRGSEAAPVILLIDRKEDPVTPLLTQWTYQAMVHEMLGIQANRVNLPASANVCFLLPHQSFLSPFYFLCLQPTVAFNSSNPLETLWDHASDKIHYPLKHSWLHSIFLTARCFKAYL